MILVDKCEIYGWMNVYYRQVAEAAGFFSKNTEERWATIRQHMLAGNPPDGPILAAAIDGVTKAERPEVLSWLETRRRESIESTPSPTGNGSWA